MHCAAEFRGAALGIPHKKCPVPHDVKYVTLSSSDFLPQTSVEPCGQKWDDQSSAATGWGWGVGDKIRKSEF